MNSIGGAVETRSMKKNKNIGKGAKKTAKNIGKGAKKTAKNIGKGVRKLFKGSRKPLKKKQKSEVKNSQRNVLEKSHFNFIEYGVLYSTPSYFNDKSNNFEIYQ